MGELADDPAGNFEQGAIPKVLHDLDVGRQSHIDEIRLQGDYFKQGTQKIVDTAITDDVFELVEDLIHPPKENFSIIWKPLNKEETFLDEIAFLGIFGGSFSEGDDLIEDMFGIVLIGDKDEEANSLIS